MSAYSVYPSDSPRCWPRAAGAIGDADAELVAAVAAATVDGEPVGSGPSGEAELTASLTEVEVGPGAFLFLDREPLRWRGSGGDGWAWSEGLFAPEGVGDWKSASRRLGACGVVAEGGRAFAHSSVAGALPLYYREHGGAVYFSTRIDALARGLPGRLGVDWEAWSSIFSVAFPVGDRTPFAEIKRLRPYSTLAVSNGRADVVGEPWPWAEIEPTRTRDEALGDVLEAMRGAVAPLADRPVISALSGGWDSRLILSLLLERDPRPEITSFTVNTDVGRTTEEDLAAAVAGAAEIPHSVVIGDPDAYWDELRERYRRSEYQRPSNAWLVTLSRRIKGLDGLVTDGLGLGAMMASGDKFITREMIDSRKGNQVARQLWRSHTGDGVAEGLKSSLRRSMMSSAKEQFLEEIDWLRGHPAQTILSRYWASTVRGFTLAPATALATELAVVAPYITDAVAAAVLSVQPGEKFEGELYRELLHASNPTLAALPSTHDVSSGGPRTEFQRRTQTSVVAEYTRVLQASPLRPYLAKRFATRVDNGDLADVLARQRSHWRIVSVVMFSLWAERYADRLGVVDPAPLLG